MIYPTGGHHLLFLLLLLLLITTTKTSQAQKQVDPLEDNGLSLLNLPTCTSTSYEISQLGPDDQLDTCILYDLNPRNTFNINAEPLFTEVTLVQVTPSICHNHRDGAYTAVTKLNEDNDGLGQSIGYDMNTHIKYRLISIVGGYNNNIGNDPYSIIHEQILNDIFQFVPNIHFILGSCSFASKNDKPAAVKYQKIVLSQVGPPGFYMDVETNPYVFGIHVNSDTYPLPALKALQFHLDQRGQSTSVQPVRVVHRDRSEFFQSTCLSAINSATDQGFNVTAIEFNPDGEEVSGVPNSQNVEYLEGLADQLCSSNESEDMNNAAIFACVQGGDADVMLARMRLNGCRPTLAWFTTATWGWATDNAETIPFFLGGGQWHENFVYSDRYFETGKAVLEYGKEEYGYMGSYDHVVSYAMPMLIQDLITSFFRIADSPNVTDVLVNRYEELRRSFVNINAQTIFGPVSFNQYQRNVGRGAAGTQWIQKSPEAPFSLGCISPLDQADAAIVIPSPSALSCSPGSYIDQQLVENDPAILADKCLQCPADTFSQYENINLQCLKCPEGSTSEVGANYCVATEDNMTPVGLKVLGYIFVVLSWASAIGYMIWLFRNRKDTVVRMGQPEALFLLCLGAIISTSAIIPLTLAEAAPGGPTRGASAACRSIPFLYSLGWVLMYTSLTAKSWRLFKVARNANQARRVKVSVREIYVIVAAVLLIDLATLISWVVVAPLQYIRSNVATTLDESTGVLTIETAGSCQGSANSVSMWAFLAPIIFIHVGSMIVTNVILFKVRGISDKYQEQKYVALASIYICELLLLGLPILIAVQESGTARYIVVAGVIFLTDTGVLALTFLPKIKYAREGLAEGETVAGGMGVNRTSTQAKGARTSVSAVEEIRRRASINSQSNGCYTSSVEAIRQRALASNVSVVSSVEETEIPSSPSSPQRVSVTSSSLEEERLAPLPLAPNLNKEEAKVSEDSDGDEFHDADTYV